jgi:replication-associated recombination protein RarA
MDYNVTVLERAFQLAKSGNYLSVPEIKKRLTKEGFSVAQVTGKTLFKQLNALIQAARGSDNAASPDANKSTGE